MAALGGLYELSYSHTLFVILSMGVGVYLV
jgi:hypothetical protein